MHPKSARLVTTQELRGRLASQWAPLLPQDVAGDAWTSIHEIAAGLESVLENAKANDPTSQSAFADPYLGSGCAGIAVFFAYLHATRVRPGAGEVASRYLELACDAALRNPMVVSLYQGFTGIGWAVQHVARILGEPPDDLSEIDGAVEQLAGQALRPAVYDLIGGLVGMGVYCLERDGSACALRALELIVERLHELAENSQDESCWFTPPQLLSEHERQKCPEGFYNLGLAHGVPGIIAFLAKAISAGVAKEKARCLLQGAVRWLLKQRLAADEGSCFPSFVSPNRRFGGSRLAWCYGDTSVASALLLTARYTGLNWWEKETLAIAAEAAMRDPATSRATDACFCHGTAGLAHMFNRIYQAYPDQRYADAAEYWLRRTLQLREPGKGAAGYLVWGMDSQDNPVLTENLSILEGIAGIGLSLLAAVSNIEPCWDRMFLVDIPLPSISS